MSKVIAVLDACVLYPAPIRDLFMHLALLDVFKARWTERIHDEWIGNLLENRPDLTREQLERTRGLMNANVMECLVEDYENTFETFDLPDPDDRHVLAAAITANADYIVTFNLKDFPREKTRPFGVFAIHPDRFFGVPVRFGCGIVPTCDKTTTRKSKEPSANPGATARYSA